MKADRPLVSISTGKTLQVALRTRELDFILLGRDIMGSLMSGQKGEFV